MLWDSHTDVIDFDNLSKKRITKALKGEKKPIIILFYHKIKLLKML